MGESAKTSVLNQWCKGTRCKNLFITDAAPFASNADKNPDLTILALVVGHEPAKTSPRERRKGNL